MQANNQAKVVVVGDISVGKTTLIKKHTKPKEIIDFELYKATIGVDFFRDNLDPKKMSLPEGLHHAFGSNLLTLNLWDIPGQERFGNMLNVYYKEAEAVVIVFDVTREGTWATVQKWLDSIKENNKGKSPMPIFIVATKCDLATPAGVKARLASEPEFWQRLEASFPGVGIYRASALDNTGIEELFKDIAAEIITNRACQVISERVKNHSMNQQSDYKFDFKDWQAKQLLTLLTSMQEQQKSFKDVSIFKSSIHSNLWQNAMTRVKEMLIIALANEYKEVSQGKTVLNDRLYQKTYDLLADQSNAGFFNRTPPLIAQQFEQAFIKSSAAPKAQSQLQR